MKAPYPKSNNTSSLVCNSTFHMKQMYCLDFTGPKWDFLLLSEDVTE